VFDIEVVSKGAGKRMFNNAGSRGMKNTLKFFLLGGIVWCAFSGAGFAQNCKYEKTDVKDVPCSFSRVEIKGGAVRKLAGQTLDMNGAVLNNAVVVVYKVVADQTVYVGTQSADSKGRFCFGKLPAGDYVVKIGARGFMCADVKVHLAPDDIKVPRGKMRPVNLSPGL
jgi:hypothetical protein